ncbi:MAG: LacI family transcriptional regulator [Opitutaceae bacterium]|jgi:LacI family transcriptional regulator|nr:LacI family transcriptional regulator [Opitutaceae bacterium]
MSIQQRVSLKQIARIAKVHHTTVSRALRNRPELPEATRKRIASIAGQLGYRPDPALSALRAYRGGYSADDGGGGDAEGKGERKARRTGFSIAFVTAFETADAWRSKAVYRRRFEGVEKRAAQLGYGLEHFWYDRSSMSGQRASQILKARNVSGLIVAPIQLASPLDLDWSRFACVTQTFSLQRVKMHIVSNNHLGTLRLAWSCLRERGYKRIGLAMDRESDVRVGRLWSTGALGEMSLEPVRNRVPPHIPPTLGREAFLRWVDRHKPDAILTITPHLHLLEWARASGRNIPGDVAFANLDCLEPTPADGISGVYQLPDVLGMISVDIVAGLIQRHDMGLPEYPQSILMDGMWIDGTTTRTTRSSGRAGALAPDSAM